MSVTHSDNLDQLAAALVKAQGSVKSAIRDSQNEFLKSRYADLASVWEACRDALTSNGLAVVQLPGYEPGAARLTTMLIHSSGQWIAGEGGAPLVGKTSRDGKEAPPDAQSMGSAITYLRRYGLAAVAGVVQEDDDAEQAVRGKPGRGKVAGGDAKDASASQPPPGAPKRAQMERPDLTQLPAALKDDPPLPDGTGLTTETWKGKVLSSMESKDLIGLRKWMEGTNAEGKWTRKMDAIDLVLAAREGE